MIWKDIIEFENLYQVSDTGLIRSKRTNKLLKCPYNKQGYQQVTVSIKGIVITRKIHRLVAIAFIPNPNKLPQINHIDENPANNNVTNLEWCTREYNMNYGHRPEKSRIVGLTHKLNKKSINVYDKEDNLIYTCNSMMDVARKLKCSYENVQAVIYHRQSYCKGFKLKRIC